MPQPQAACAAPPWRFRVRRGALGIGLAASSLLWGLACPSGPSKPRGIASSSAAGSGSADASAPLDCAKARALRSRVPRLREEGKLYRALFVIAKANDLCREQREETLGAEVETLAEIGRARDAEQLLETAPADSQERARKLLAERRAPPATDEERAAARHELEAAIQDAWTLESAPLRSPSDVRALAERFERAGERGHPDVEALYWAGHLRSLLGESAAGQRLFDRAAVLAEEGSVMSLDTDTGEGSVWAVRWSPDGRRLALGRFDPRGSGQLAVVLSARNYQPERIVNAQYNQGLAWSPDGRTLVTGSTNDTASMWDIATGHGIHRFEGHKQYMHTAAFSPDGRTLAIGSWGGPQLWDVGTGEPLSVLDGTTGIARSLAFSPMGAFSRFGPRSTARWSSTPWVAIGARGPHGPKREPSCST